MHVTGSCHCGAIRYEADVDPAIAIVCHCTDCQKFSGSAFRVSILTTPGSLRLLAGKPRSYTKVAESGRPSEQQFCERCGSHLFGVVPGSDPQVARLRLGSIDQREQLAPTNQLWTRSRLAWVTELGDLHGKETQ